MSKLKGKAGIRAFLLANVGKVVTTEQIRDASGGQVQYSRRLRELREREGWKISSNNDRTDLGPGEYRLEEPPPDRSAYQFTRGISQRLRAQVLERNGYTCQMCGIGAGDPAKDGRPARLHVGHIVDRSHGGTDTLDNLRALCSQCDQGAKNVTQEPPSHTWLISQLRRASASDQREILNWLLNKFAKQ